MRISIAIVLLTTNFFFVYGQEISEHNDPKKRPTSTNKTFVKEIKGKSIAYYLNHKEIDQTAKLFYKGEYAVYDDEGTFSFLDSILTKNTNTAPFYFFLYNQVMTITDGAISEYMAGVCRKHVEKYPCEFIANSADKEYQVDINKWTAFIAFDLNDLSDYEKYTINIEKQIKGTCPSSKTEWDKLKVKIMDNLGEK